MSNQGTRDIVVVGDENVAVPLSYMNIDWNVHRVSTMTALFEGMKNRSIPRPVAVIATDMTGETRQELNNAVMTLVVYRMPVALIAFRQDTIDFYRDPANVQRFKQAITDKHGQLLEAKQRQGATITAADLENPLDSTHFTIAPATRGAKFLLEQFGPYMLVPLTPEELGTLGPQHERPFPAPTGGAGFGTSTTRRRGRIITVVSDKGGCGKSTVSLMLGSAITYWTYLGKQPKSVVVVDLDRQSQLVSQFPNATSDVTKVRSNSTKDELRAALHHVEALGEFYVLLGARTNSQHVAVRNVELYSHLIPMLAEMFDVVIVDGSVGMTSDPVTVWAQQNADGVYYVLDQMPQSIDMATQAQEVVSMPVDKGGMGIDPERFRVILNRFTLDAPKDFKDEWGKSVVDRLGETAVEAIIPNSDPEVTYAYAEENGVLYLVQTSELLQEPLRLLAKRIFPDVVPDPDKPSKKKWWSRA